MPAQRIADRSEMCPTCDALVAGLSALVLESPGVLPTADELRKRAGVPEAALVAHVGSPAGCFALAFERATDRLYAGVAAQLELGEPSPLAVPERLTVAIRVQLDALDPGTPAGAVILGADQHGDPAIRAALARWQARAGLPASGSGRPARDGAARLGASASPSASRRSGRAWRPRTAPEPAP